MKLVQAIGSAIVRFCDQREFGALADSGPFGGFFRGMFMTGAAATGSFLGGYMANPASFNHLPVSDLVGFSFALGMLSIGVPGLAVHTVGLVCKKRLASARH